jgi:hypothetical protein
MTYAWPLKKAMGSASTTHRSLSTDCSFRQLAG